MELRLALCYKAQGYSSTFKLILRKYNVGCVFINMQIWYVLFCRTDREFEETGTFILILCLVISLCIILSTVFCVKGCMMCFKNHNQWCHWYDTITIIVTSSEVFTAVCSFLYNYNIHAAMQLNCTVVCNFIRKGFMHDLMMFTNFIQLRSRTWLYV